MAFTRQCDRCKEHFPPDKVRQLNYFTQGIGVYHTIHLCDERCHKDFDAFLKGNGIPAEDFAR